MNHAPPRKSIQRVDNRKGKAPRLSIKDLMSLNESNDDSPGNQSRRKSYYLPQQSPAERSAHQSSTTEGFSPSMRGATPKGLSMIKVESSETKAVIRPHRGSEIYSPMGTEIFDDNKEVIIKILGKPSERRTHDEIAILQKSFADIQFFKKTEQELEPQYYKMLFKNLKLETFQPGQRVFSHGDEGNKFYIIIQGGIYIMLKKKGIFEQDPSSAQIVADRFIKGFNEEGLTNEKKIRKVEDHYPGFWVARVMKAGESFGDIALQVSGDRTRTATVVCKEATLFGVLSFEDYQFSLGRLFEKKYGEKIDFLATINLFQHWSINQISALLLDMEEHKYQRKQIIFKEGENSKSIHFVLNGEVELWKKVDIDDKSSTFMIRPNSQAPVSPTRLKAIKKKKDMRLAVITTGQYFGASGITDDKPREYSAVVSVADTRLLSLSKDKFFTLVKDRQSLKRLAAHIMQKDASRENRTTNYVNINTYYGNFADVDKSPPVPILPELSPKNWPDLSSFKNPDTISPNKGLKSVLTPSRPQLLPSLIHNNSSENTPKSTKSNKKLTRNQTSSSPPPSIYKAEANHGLERFKILNFEQKSLLQKKSEFNQSYAKLQRKLTKMLDAKEQEEAATNCIDMSGQGQADQEDDGGYELNFIKKGQASRDNSPLRLQTFVADTIESNYSVTEESSPWLPFSNKGIVSPHRRKIKSHLHESLKYKLIKKLGIDKLYQTQTESSEILPTQGSFQSDLPRSPKVIQFQAVGASNIQSPRSSTNSGILKKMQNRSLNFNSASSEASRLSFHSQNRSQIGSNNGSRITEKKASKSIYGKIHQIIGSNKE